MPVEDLDETGTLHIKVTNNDTAAKSFTITTTVQEAIGIGSDGKYHFDNAGRGVVFGGTIEASSGLVNAGSDEVVFGTTLGGATTSSPMLRNIPTLPGGVALTIGSAAEITNYGFPANWLFNITHGTDTPIDVSDNTFAKHI